jgi:hypothetical protein
VPGLRQVERDGRTFYEADPASSEVYWARFYDLATNRPIFSGAQDGRIYTDFGEFWKNSTTGYDYYTKRPIDLITKEQKQWRKALDASTAALPANTPPSPAGRAKAGSSAGKKD